MTKTKLLTRVEELILLAVWQLDEQAYSKQLREHICKISLEDWSIGSIYMPLERLEKRGLLTSSLSKHTPERGGRQKRIYKLTRSGKVALNHLREIQTALWKTMPEDLLAE
ncbi:MAG: PadR family transcriptional regulator [Rhodothermaceae bacterium]